MTTTLRNATAAPLGLHQHKDGSWTYRTGVQISDESASALSFHADPKQVILGAFIEVIDPDGTRIGHLSGATYVERFSGPAYVVVTITLR